MKAGECVLFWRGLKNEGGVEAKVKELIDKMGLSYLNMNTSVCFSCNVSLLFIESPKIEQKSKRVSY